MGYAKNNKLAQQDFVKSLVQLGATSESDVRKLYDWYEGAIHGKKGQSITLSNGKVVSYNDVKAAGESARSSNGGVHLNDYNNSYYYSDAEVDKTTLKDYVDSLLDTNNDDSYINSLKKSQEELDNSNPTKDGSGLDKYQDAVDNMLMTDANSQAAQDYKQAMYGSIDAYEQSTNATLGASELDAYKMLGQQQLQLENSIAQQRMQAIKSGTTSAQLASQQLANIFSAQSGAAQVAQSVMQQKATNANTFGQQRAAVTSDLYSLLNSNQQTAANTYTQLGAAQASYNSYIQQPYAQYNAAIGALNKVGPTMYDITLNGQTNQK